jgi:hypothetical protein
MKPVAAEGALHEEEGDDAEDLTSRQGKIILLQEAFFTVLDIYGKDRLFILFMDRPPAHHHAQLSG